MSTRKCAEGVAMKNFCAFCDEEFTLRKSYHPSAGGSVLRVESEKQFRLRRFCGTQCSNAHRRTPLAHRSRYKAEALPQIGAWRSTPGPQNLARAWR